MKRNDEDSLGTKQSKEGENAKRYKDEQQLMIQKQYIFGSIFLLDNRLQSIDFDLLEDMTLKQWFLLIMIKNIDLELPSVQDVANFIGSTRQNIKKMLDSLEKLGYVRLEIARHDRRSYSVTLTDKCYQYFEQHAKAGEEVIDLLFAGISDKEIECTSNLFNTLFYNIEGMRTDKNEIGNV
jgi:DNA-binding MarR family transcriptional regulator